MSINFNLDNITTKEGRLQVARTLLAPSVDRFATEKRIFGRTHANDFPTVIVDSPLLRNLAIDYDVNDISGLAVTRTKGGMGKTVAATILLNYATRGIMFHGAMETSTYWRNM